MKSQIDLGDYCRKYRNNSQPGLYYMPDFYFPGDRMHKNRIRNRINVLYIELHKSLIDWITSYHPHGVIVLAYQPDSLAVAFEDKFDSDYFKLIYGSLVTDEWYWDSRTRKWRLK